MKRAWMICLGLAGIFFLGGCASVRVKTDLMPEENPEMAVSSAKFYIAGLNYTVNDGCGRQVKSPIDSAYEKNLLRSLRNECSAGYPGLFTGDSSDAFPLWVEVTDEITTRDGKFIAWMLCTLTVTPMIFPAPVGWDRDIHVSAGLWNGHEGIAGQKTGREFRREENLWVSVLTPFALIPVPGKSDLPKRSDAFNWGRFAYDDIPDVARQVATSLAKTVVSREPAFWAKQSLHVRSPVYSPAASGTSPVALPLPTQTAAPF